jgi:hypothetical protein
MKKRILALLAAIVFAVTLIIPFATPVMASMNQTNMDLSVDTNPAYNGDTVRYAVRIFNGFDGDPAADIAVSFQPPGADGLPDPAAQFYLGTIASLLPGDEVLFDTGNTGDDDLSATGPHAAIRHKYAPGLAVVLALSPGVLNAISGSIYEGRLDNEFQDQVNCYKQITLIVDDPVETAEVVPELRWAGEKMVLEQDLGIVWAGTPVSFILGNDSPGALEGVDPVPAYPGGELYNSTGTVWSSVGSDGLARCLLASENQGEVNVNMRVYDQEAWNAGSMVISAGYLFKVYFLRFEEVKLSSVAGSREGGNTGLWTPPNPWDKSLDLTSDTRDLSQDSLLRCQVKGWFLAATPSTRAGSTQDIDQDGEPELSLPAGRWVMPDDWGILAGQSSPENRIYCDIMDSPLDAVVSESMLGPYNSAGGATAGAVIGPFSPGIEVATAEGWDVTSASPDPLRAIKTVVPDGVVDRWDAPMPPAKVIFEITGGGGCFQTSLKGEVYYLNPDGNMVYTNPFYQAMIPAHEAIPPFVNNGGYDWRSFDTESPYQFWTMVNQLPGNTPADAEHPTKVEVYSDNHGEAMVFYNRVWNTDLGPVAAVQARADYPYFRKHVSLLSNPVIENLINTTPENPSISLPCGTTVNFSEITGTGVTAVATRDTGPALPSGFQLGLPPLYYDITTTASYAGTIYISLQYDPLQFTVDESELKLLHWENDAFVDRTTAVDTDNHIIYGEVSSFSDFVIAQASTPETEVTLNAADLTVPVNTATTLTTVESNTGNTLLTGVYVTIQKNGEDLTTLDAAGAVESLTEDDILGPGETWTWSGIETGNITDDVTFTAIGHGLDPLGHDITYPEYPGERDAVTVSRERPHLEMYLVDSLTGAVADAPGYGYYTACSSVRVRAAGLEPGTAIAGWSLIQYVPDTNPQFLGSAGPGDTEVTVTGTIGEAVVWALLSDNRMIYADIKWGTISRNSLTEAQSIPVVWDEATGRFSPEGTVNDTVYGSFTDKNGVTSQHPVSGAILNWYLIRGDVAIPRSAAEAANLKATLADATHYPRAALVDFTTCVRTVTDNSGQSRVSLAASGQEMVQVVVVPEYSPWIQLSVTPGVATMVFVPDDAGSISGNAAGVWGANVDAYAVDNGAWILANRAVSGRDGAYSLALSPGEYRVKAYRAGYVPEWYLEISDQDGASPVSVGAYTDTAGTDFTLDSTPWVLGPDYIDICPDRPPQELRMVMSAGNYDGSSIDGIYPYQYALSRTKMAWVWMTDQNNRMEGAAGKKVEWSIQADGGGVQIPAYTGPVSPYNEITNNILIQNGFLAGTGGQVTDPGRTAGYNYTREPTTYEKRLFKGFFPELNPDNYAVAAMEVESPTYEFNGLITIHIDPSQRVPELSMGRINCFTELGFALLDPLGPEEVIPNNPGTAVNITTADPEVPPDTGTTLTVTESNTGDVPLTDPRVVLLKNGAVWMELAAPPTSGDAACAGTLGPGETWTWSGIETGNLTEAATFTATGHGLDPLGNDITYPEYPGERDEVQVSLAPPVLSGLTPDANAAGSEDLEIAADGINFAADSVLKWQDSDGITELTTVFISSIQLQAIIPASLINIPKTGDMWVFSQTRGSSNIVPFFVTQTGTPVTDVGIGTSSDSQGTATATIASSDPDSPDCLTATAEGSGTLAVAQYQSNPGSTPGFNSADVYFDVYLSQTSSFSEVSILINNLNGGTLVYWWNDSDWGAVSNQTYDPISESVTIIVTDQTVPNIEDLHGSFFGVARVAPSIAPLDICPATPSPLGTTTVLNTQFSDPFNAGPYAVEIDWGDQSAPLTFSSDTPLSIRKNHTYLKAGMFIITVSVTDKHGSTGSAATQYIVIYDPNGGFVTGGGWINSPAGSDASDPGWYGKASFSFVSKYQKGAQIPGGQTEFNFHAGNLKFSSVNYEWLVVSGARAQLKGTGTIHGSRAFGFIITAIDGQKNGGRGVDKFRIKIWDLATSAIVYDNKMGAIEAGEAATEIGGGSIVIHKS